MAVFLLITAILQIIHIQFSLYSICWYLSWVCANEDYDCIGYSYSTCWYLSVIGFVIGGGELTFSYSTCWYLSNNSDIKVVMINGVFVQHLLIFINWCIGLEAWTPKFSYSTCWYLSGILQRIKENIPAFSYSTCWYLSNMYSLNGFSKKLFSYSTCWYLSLMLLGFINYIIVINY